MPPAPQHGMQTRGRIINRAGGRKYGFCGMWSDHLRCAKQTPARGIRFSGVNKSYKMGLVPAEKTEVQLYTQTLVASEAPLCR